MNQMKTYMLMAAMVALFMGVGYIIGGRAGMFMALIFAAASNAFAYWNSDRMVLAQYRAREVDARSAPEYYGVVAELARNAGLPMPRVYVLDQDQPNAFATGRDPDHAAVAASQGLLDMMTREELAGVMAHELAHVKNRDTLTMTITATIAGAISALGNFGMFFGGRDQNGNRTGILGVLLATLVAPFAAMLVQMAVSRTREYAADRMGAEICRDPRALASALAKISGGVQAIPNYDAERHPASAHLFIINPLTGHGMDSLFSTHPNTENRIAALMEMAATMPAPPPAPRRDAGPIFGGRSFPGDGGTGPSGRGPWG